MTSQAHFCHRLSGRSSGVFLRHVPIPTRHIAVRAPAVTKTAKGSCGHAHASARCRWTAHPRWGIVAGGPYPPPRIIIAASSSASISTSAPTLRQLWSKFIPMASLFFLLSFVNTVLDTLKDTLVITAVGGGTQVIPFITVYGVLPASFLFLLAFSAGTRRFPRRHLFNVVIGCFLTFLAAFALVFPAHEALHLGSMALWLRSALPDGLAGAVGMLRNWLFTLFYCTSELWGDACLSLLFWGLANETTRWDEAPVLYPLYGIGANIAQTMAGRIMRLVFASSGGKPATAYSTRLRAMLALCCALCCAIIALQAWIAGRFRKQEAVVTVVSQTGSSDSSTADMTTENKKENDEAGMSLGQAWNFLRHSPPIRCLALIAISQGVTSNLLDLAWKHHLHRMASSPAAYSAILGDTAMWTGIVTGSLMFLSPALFRRLGWGGIAKTTPRVMLFIGIPFFLGAITYNFWLVGTASGPLVLRALVLLGALLQVGHKGAKFSMFKPAEEMVYIGLDKESRSKGKAAIDVVGAQSGKSISSLLQQTLLLLSGGHVPHILPVMAACFLAMIRQWLGAVTVLAGLIKMQHDVRPEVDTSSTPPKEEEEGKDGASMRDLTDTLSTKP